MASFKFTDCRKETFKNEKLQNLMSIPMDAVLTMQAIMSAGLGLLVFFVRKYVKDQDKRWEQQEVFRAETQRKMSSIEVNYLDRFKDVANQIMSTEATLRDKVVESERNVISKIIEMHDKLPSRK